MRKLAFAALCGVLVLAGCGDDSRTSPMEPAPEASDAIRCIQPGFPLKLALEQIAGTRSTTALYPKSNPRRLALALARVAEIAALWTFCKPTLARTKLVQHTTILLDDLRAGNRLVGGASDETVERVITHINTMWQGVGFQPPNPPVFTGTGNNFGFGLFLPNTGPLTVVTASGNGAVRIPDNGYNEPTLITILQRSSDDNPFDDDEGNPPVFSPFFEIIASNASNKPYLVNDLRATVAVCVDDEIDPGILGLEDPAIAHIAVPNVDDSEEPGGFEILDETSTAGLEGFVCEPDLFNSLFDGGLKGFASAAPGYLRAAATSFFLPTVAEAAAAATVGKTGLGGLARSLSPFGVTDRDTPPPPIPTSFGSGGWSYKQIGNLDPVPGEWLTITPTAADGWATGSAPFGSNDVSGCGLAQPSTPWDVGTTMLLRRDVFIPANTASATIDVLIDNDVFVFVNGEDVSSPLFHHENCADLNPLPGFTVQASPNGPLLPGQVNKIFIRGVDLGVQSYLDAKVTLTPTEP